MGFRSRRPILNQVVNLDLLNKLEDGTIVNAETLKANGLIKSLNHPFKILGDGDIKKSLIIQEGAISKTAQEKIATFLLDMAKRIFSDDEHVELPMQRSDIADHLGLTIETVSRTLTCFARQGLIRLQAGSRSVDLCNMAALRKLDA